MFQCHNPPKVAPFLTPWTVVWLVGYKVVRILSQLLFAICVSNDYSYAHLRAESSAANVEIVDELHIICRSNSGPSANLAAALILDRDFDLDVRVSDLIVAEVQGQSRRGASRKR